jgi:hypothetical protein
LNGRLQPFPQNGFDECAQIIKFETVSAPSFQQARHKTIPIYKMREQISSNSFQQGNFRGFNKKNIAAQGHGAEEGKVIGNYSASDFG